MFSTDFLNIGMVTQNPALKAVTRVLYYVLPNFHNFDVIGQASHGFVIPPQLIFQNTLYALLYSAILLIAAAAVFSGRNLK
jgi:hypothetical protein